jgi:hypothetical protein
VKLVARLSPKEPVYAADGAAGLGDFPDPLELERVGGMLTHPPVAWGESMPKPLKINNHLIKLFILKSL